MAIGEYLGKVTTMTDDPHNDVIISVSVEPQLYKVIAEYVEERGETMQEFCHKVLRQAVTPEEK